MSVEVMVFLHSRSLPSSAQWEEAIESLGHRVTLGKFSITDHRGLLPVELDGEVAGFELDIAATSDVIESPDEDDPDLVAAVEDRDLVAFLKVHGGRKTDLQAAIIAAVGLAHRFDGVYLDPQSGEFAVSQDSVKFVSVDG